MSVPVNYLAILASAVVIFMLGGLWYSPVLFGNRWVALQNKSAEEMAAMKAGPGMYVQVFLTGLIISIVVAVLIANVGPANQPNAVTHGALIGFCVWVAAAASSYATALFSYKSRPLWAIDTSYNLVSMVLAGIILSAWR